MQMSDKDNDGAADRDGDLGLWWHRCMSMAKVVVASGVAGKASRDWHRQRCESGAT